MRFYVTKEIDALFCNCRRKIKEENNPSEGNNFLSVCKEYKKLLKFDVGIMFTTMIIKRGIEAEKKLMEVISREDVDIWHIETKKGPVQVPVITAAKK